MPRLFAHLLTVAVVSLAITLALELTMDTAFDPTERVEFDPKLRTTIRQAAAGRKPDETLRPKGPPPAPVLVETPDLPALCNKQQLRIAALEAEKAALVEAAGKAESRITVLQDQLRETRFDRDSAREALTLARLTISELEDQLREAAVPQPMPVPARKRRSSDTAFAIVVAAVGIVAVCYWVFR